MIVYRLAYVLEKIKVLSEHQSGLRKGRSTADALVKVSNEIEKTLNNMKEVMAAVFFDTKKAHDSMWREGLSIKFNKLGIGGRLYNWVNDFLSDRTFKVKVGSEIPKRFDNMNGIPQGSVVSPILFNIMINILKTQEQVYSHRCMLMMVQYGKGERMSLVLKCMQKAIVNFEKCSYDWGFKISVEKSCYMLITKKKISNKQALTLYSMSMEKVRVFKYLGLWMDERYARKNHIETIETKCKKVLNLMRCVVGFNWRADREALLHIYRALMRATLD